MASEPAGSPNRKAPTPRGRMMPPDADTSFEPPLEESVRVPREEAVQDKRTSTSAEVGIGETATVTAETNHPTVNAEQNEEWTFWQTAFAYGLGLLAAGGFDAGRPYTFSMAEIGAALIHASTMQSPSPVSGGPYYLATNSTSDGNADSWTGFAISLVGNRSANERSFGSWIEFILKPIQNRLIATAIRLEIEKVVGSLRASNTGPLHYMVLPGPVSRSVADGTFKVTQLETLKAAYSKLQDVVSDAAPYMKGWGLPTELQNGTNVDLADIITPDGGLNWPLIEEIGKRWFTEGGVPQLRIDHDLALEDPSNDQLGFDVYANAIAALIQLPETGTPLTLAINAPWGSGKSSLANMIKARLKERRQGIFFCDFNAWLHDEASNLGGAFTAAVIRSAASNRHGLRRFFQPLPWKAKSPNDRAASVRQVLVVSFLGVTGMFVADWFGYIALDMTPYYRWMASLVGKEAAPFGTGVAGAAGAALLITNVQKLIEPIWKSLIGMILDPQAAAMTGSLADVRQRLADLIRHATGGGKRRMVIFIDDIERCQPPRSLEICETINQLVGHPGVVVVMLGDMQAVEACAAIKYKDLAEIYNPALHGQKLDGVAKQTAYGRHYLQKIIQLQFDLPPHRPQRIDSMMERQVAMTEVAAVPSISPSKLGQAMRIIPIERWISGGLNPLGLSAHLSEVFTSFLETAKIDTPLTALRRIRLFLQRTGWISLNLCVVSLFIEQALKVRYGPIAEFVVPGTFILLAVPLIGFADGLKPLIAKKEAELAAKSASATALDDESLDAAVQGAGKDVSKEAVKSALRIQLSDQLIGGNELLLDAHRAALDFLPPTPRNAKRLLNSLRLSLFILRARNLLPSADLTPRHIGKWAALKERWPFLAQIIIRNPGVVAKLEDCPRDVRAHRIAKICPELSGDPKFGDFLEIEPKLAGVIERLVYFSDAGAAIESDPDPSARAGA